LDPRQKPPLAMEHHHLTGLLPEMALHLSLQGKRLKHVAKRR